MAIRSTGIPPDENEGEDSREDQEDANQKPPTYPAEVATTYPVTKVPGTNI